MTGNITTQTVLVTGSSIGLGYQMVYTLLEKGSTVVAAMRQLKGQNAPAAANLKIYATQHPGTLHSALPSREVQ